MLLCLISLRFFSLVVVSRFCFHPNLPPPAGAENSVHLCTRPCTQLVATLWVDKRCCNSRYVCPIKVFGIVGPELIDMRRKMIARAQSQSHTDRQQHTHTHRHTWWQTGIICNQRKHSTLDTRLDTQRARSHRTPTGEKRPTDMCPV